MSSFLAIFNIGQQEWILIFVIVFLLFGAKKLPELARGIGRSLGEFKKAKEDFNRELTESEKKLKEQKENPTAPSDTEPKV